MNLEKIEKAVRDILLAVGENPDREGLVETPKRVAKMYEEILSGMKEDPKKHISKYFNEINCGDLVFIKDLEFSSLCEHHLLPFRGKVHVAYVPSENKILGLSKVGRIVDTFSKRLQVQERLTSQVAKLIMEELNPKGVYVIIEAEHFCMSMRGLKKPGSKTITSVAFGQFKEDDFLKTKVINLIKNGS